MKNSKKLLAQGDILIIPVDSIPSNLNPVKSVNGKIHLAEGEVTGHFHGIDESDLLTAVQDNRFIYFETTASPTTIQHQEHAPITLEPNTKYKVVKQREFVYQGEKTTAPVQD